MPGSCQVIARPLNHWIQVNQGIGELQAFWELGEPLCRVGPLGLGLLKYLVMEGLVSVIRGAGATGGRWQP